MSQKNRIYASLEFEYLLTRLFGKYNYHGYVGEKSFKEWKRDLAKVFRSILRALTLNVETDE